MMHVKLAREPHNPKDENSNNTVGSSFGAPGKKGCCSSGTNNGPVTRDDY